MSEYIFDVPDSNQPIADDTGRYYPDERDESMIVREEIVRCRDCKYYDESTIDDEGEGEPSYCYRWCEEWIRDDGYCAWAERRDD